MDQWMDERTTFFRSAHSNAYFYGFGSNKCIVLFDTLLQKDMLPQEIGKNNEEKESEDIIDDNENEDKQQQEKEEDTEYKETEKKDEVKEKGCSIEEILAVLSHELGHWQYSHNLKNIFVAEVTTSKFIYLYNSYFTAQLLSIFLFIRIFPQFSRYVLEFWFSRLSSCYHWVYNSL